MSESVCFEKFSDITDNHIDPSLRTISCCMKVAHHILFFSNLHFLNLHTLKQLDTCNCTTNMYGVFVHSPSRLPKLQKIYYFDGIPATLRFNDPPIDGLLVFYLLVKNIEDIRIRPLVFMCLREVTCFDKGLVKHICSYVTNDDLLYLHVKAMEQLLNEQGRVLSTLKNALVHFRRYLPRASLSTNHTVQTTARQIEHVTNQNSITMSNILKLF